MDTKHEGWSNYETWRTHLELTQTKEPYESLRRLAKKAYRGAGQDNVYTKEQNAALSMMDTLRALVENGSEDLQSDLLDAALRRIDYFEIATELVTEVLWSPE